MRPIKFTQTSNFIQKTSSASRLLQKTTTGGFKLLVLYAICRLPACGQFEVFRRQRPSSKLNGCLKLLEFNRTMRAFSIIQKLK